DLEIIRPDALQRRQRPHEHVIHASELTCLLNRSHVLRLLDDADDAVIAIGGAAERAGIGVCDVVADRAVGDALFHVANRVDQPFGVIAWSLEDVKRKPLRALRADAGKALQLLDQSGQRFWKCHYAATCVTTRRESSCRPSSRPSAAQAPRPP